MRVRTTTRIFTFIVLLVTAIVAQQAGAPVPSEWVSRDTLMVSSLNFSITAPAGWRWQQRQLPDIQGGKATAFLAAGPDADLQYSVIVWQKESAAFQQTDVDRFVRGMAESLPAGWKPLDVQVRDSHSPRSGSAKFRTKLRTPDNRDFYQYGYLVPGRWSYILLTYAPDETEPPAFSTFARSFKLLNPSQNTYAPPSAVIVPLLLLAAIVGAFFDWRYVRAGGVRPTGKQKLYLGITVAICALLLIALALLGGSAEGLGQASALLTVLIFALWEFGRFRVRRGNPTKRVSP